MLSIPQRRLSPAMVAWLTAVVLGIGLSMFAPQVSRGDANESDSTEESIAALPSETHAVGRVVALTLKIIPGVIIGNDLYVPSFRIPHSDQPGERAPRDQPAGAIRGRAPPGWFVA